MGSDVTGKRCKSLHLFSLTLGNRLKPRLLLHYPLFCSLLLLSVDRHALASLEFYNFSVFTAMFHL